MQTAVGMHKVDVDTHGRTRTHTHGHTHTHSVCVLSPVNGQPSSMVKSFVCRHIPARRWVQIHTHTHTHTHAHTHTRANTASSHYIKLSVLLLLLTSQVFEKKTQNTIYSHCWEGEGNKDWLGSVGAEEGAGLGWQSEIEMIGGNDGWRRKVRSNKVGDREVGRWMGN